MKSTTTKATEMISSETNPDDLPEGWAETTLGEIARWASGGTPKSTEAKYYDGGIPWLVIGDLNDGVVKGSTKTISALGLQNSSAKYVDPGSILVAMYGSIGKLGIAGLRCATNQAIAFTTEISKGIERDYLYFYLLAARPTLLELGKGGTQANISQTVLKAFPAVTAPLVEQHRILSKIEGLLKHVNSSRDHLARVSKILKSFRQSVLSAACSGRLTEDWREEHLDIESATDLLLRIKKRRLESAETNKDRTQVLMAFESWNLEPSDEGLRFSNIPESWTACRIGAIGSVCNGSTPSRQHQEFWAGNICWVSSGEVRNNIISETRERITKEGYESTSVRHLPMGTVLIAMIGEGKTRGQSAILEIEATINQNIAAIILDHGLINPKYLWRWFQLQYEATREEGSGTGPQALNCQRVRELPFIIPPFNEQDEIVRRVEALFKFADTIQKRVEAATKRTDKLTRAVLAKAFRGELVPTEAELARREGRDYEPASVLLDRIRAERQAESDGPNRIRRRTPVAKGPK